MKNLKKTMVEKEVVDSMTCDVCNKTYSYKNDLLELQEFYHFENTGGYDSLIGDGVKIECDICQHCAQNLLGKYFRKIES